MRDVSVALLAGALVGAPVFIHACSTTQPLPVSPCEVRAALALPLDDPEAISVGDVRELAQRLRACRPQGDAGQ